MNYTFRVCKLKFGATVLVNFIKENGLTNNRLNGFLSFRF